MCKCAIVGEEQLIKLLMRYDGIGKPITSDEREILLFALYNESKERGGIVLEAEAREREIIRKQRLTNNAAVENK